MLTQEIPTFRIVLVEDDPAQARLLTQVLANNVAGEVKIATFTDPREAATYIDHELVDILVTDLDMPGIDGLELIRLAKRHNNYTQSLMMTAVSTSDSIICAGDLGATDYLLKPVDHQLLVRLIHQSVDRLERWQKAFSGTLNRCRKLRQVE